MQMARTVECRSLIIYAWTPAAIANRLLRKCESQVARPVRTLFGSATRAIPIECACGKSRLSR
jgi:hypothetical protein